MSRQTPAWRRGVAKTAVHNPEDRHRMGLKTQQHHNDLPQDLLCSKEEPDCCPDTHHSEPYLSRTLYLGSARPFSNAACTPQGAAMAHYNYSSANSRQEAAWSPDHMHLPQPSPSQFTFPVSPSSGTNGQASSRRGSGKKSQSAAKRLVAQDFHNLVHLPTEHFETLHDYVGADSRYTLAGTHAGIYVRSCAESVDLVNRLRESGGALERILDFFRFIHTIPKETLKPEQKGCFTLRVSYCALTALLGDFSNSAETPPSDPQAPILLRHQLSTFRDHYPKLRVILSQLSAEFEVSINTYRHRRSPSASVVAKLQAILRTLEVWNQALGDDTFTKPTSIIRTWLDNHPTQVDGTRRMRIPSTQPSPCPSDLRQSPRQYEVPLFPQTIDTYNPGQPHSSPVHINAIPPSMTAQTYLSPSAYNQTLFVDNSHGTTFYPAPYDLSSMYGMNDSNMGYRQ